MMLSERAYPFQGRRRKYLIADPGIIGEMVILGLHGKGQSAAAFAAEALLHERAPGAAVIYPQGAGLIPSWNAGSEPPTTWAEEQAIDDIAFLRDLLARERLSSNLVYACGISNGGRFAYHLAGDTAMLMGMASVAGVPSDPTISCGQTCTSILHLHGDADWIEPFNGGGSGGGGLPGAPGIQRFRDAGYDPVEVRMIPGGVHRWDFGTGHDTTGVIMAAWGLLQQGGSDG